MGLGIYWSNHHHLLQASQRVNGGILWANLHLLFWLTLIPFVTNWMGDIWRAAVPVALCAVVMAGAAIAHFILTRSLIRHPGTDSTLAHAVGRDAKGIVSLALYSAAVMLAFVDTRIAIAVFVAVAIMWLVPGRRIERTIEP